MNRYLVIGGSSGIGKSTVQGLLDSGAIVYATFNKTEMDFSHPNLQSFKYDVLTDEFPSQRMPESLDGLVYCPGNINLKPFRSVSKSVFQDDLQLQVIGAIDVIQNVLPLLKKSDKASIVLFSTVAVQMGYNYHSVVATSKGAVEGLARSLAAEFAPKIRVNVIAPSLTATPLAGRLINTEQKIQSNAERHPLKRIGTAEDISEAAIYLLGTKSSWMTGQVLKIDGGMSSINS